MLCVVFFSKCWPSEFVQLITSCESRFQGQAAHSLGEGPNGRDSVASKPVAADAMMSAVTCPKVHGADVVRHYELLRDYLCMFAGSPTGLPDLEHHKAIDETKDQFSEP